jgi:hypothetical protein
VRIRELFESADLCAECGNPSWKTLESDDLDEGKKKKKSTKKKGSHGKVCWKGYRRGKGDSCHRVKGDG